MVDDTDTRQRILDVARDLFIAGGLTGLSMRKVAAEVGVSATAIYRHFDSKEALVVAVIEEGFRRFAEYLWRGLDARDPLARLHASCTQYARFALDHSAYYRVMFMTPCDELGYVAVPERTADSIAPTFRFLMDRVRECIDNGDLADDDLESLSATIWAHLHGLVSLHLAAHLSREQWTRQDFLAFYDASVRRLVEGLAARG